MNRSILILLPLFILSQEVKGQELSKVDYQIYSKVLTALLLDEKVHGTRILVQKESETETETKFAIKEINLNDKTIQRLVNEFGYNFKMSVVFDDYFLLDSFQALTLTKEEINSLLVNQRDSGWIDLRRKFPKLGGIVSMSKMTLNPTKTSGLIYISIHKNFDEGVGYLIFFDLNDRRIIKVKQRVWIS